MVAIFVYKECDFDLCSGFAEGSHAFLLFMTSNRCIALQNISDSSATMPHENKIILLCNLVHSLVFCVVTAMHNFELASYKQNTNSDQLKEIHTYGFHRLHMCCLQASLCYEGPRAAPCAKYGAPAS